MQQHDSMRVAYVVKRYPRYSETFIVNEILAHEAAGLEVEIFSLYPPNDTHFQDVIAKVRAPVTYLSASGLKAADLWSAVETAGTLYPDVWSALRNAQGEDVREVYQALLLAAELHRRGITHLHAHFATSSTSVARLASLFSGIPYTFTAHAKDIFHESVEAADLATKLRDAAAVVTVSDYNTQYLRDCYTSSATEIVRIYNGLDLARFPFALPAERAGTIVSVGRLIEKKGFKDLIEACAVLRRRGKAFRCELLGGGPLESDLWRQIEQLDLQGTVFLLGPRPQFEVIQRVQQASVFTAPCVVGTDGNRDGLPTVLLEAMALGTPCISTDVTGIPEVLVHGETGLMVAQHDPHGLADALERLLDDQALRVRLACQARQRIEANFDIHQNAARLRELFVKVTPSDPTTLVEMSPCG